LLGDILRLERELLKAVEELSMLRKRLPESFDHVPVFDQKCTTIFGPATLLELRDQLRMLVTHVDRGAGWEREEAAAAADVVPSVVTFHPFISMHPIENLGRQKEIGFATR
jgi:hypothetical protein